MDVCSWYLVKIDLCIVHVCSHIHWTSHFLPGTIKTPPCLSGQVVAMARILLQLNFITVGGLLYNLRGNISGYTIYHGGCQVLSLWVNFKLNRAVAHPCFLGSIFSFMLFLFSTLCKKHFGSYNNRKQKKENGRFFMAGSFLQLDYIMQNI